MPGDRSDHPTAPPEAGLFGPLFPAEWPRRPLWDTATWINGLAFRDINFSEAGDPVIKIAELKGGISPNTKWTRQQFDPKFRVVAGDVLYSWSGSPETSLDVFEWSGPSGWLNQHIFKVIAAEGVDRGFHIQLLRYLRPNLVAIATNKQTTGLGHVTQKDLQRLVVGLPPVREQRAIAHILGTLDDKIELNRRTNETLVAMARALFKSWFVDFDPVRAKASGRQPAGMDAETAALFPGELVESELGEIPKGWPLGSLGAVMELKRGYDLPQAERREGTVPIVSSSGHSGFHHEAMSRAPGIVTGRYGTIGRVFLVREDFWPLNTTLYVRDLRGSDVFFAYHLLETIDFRKFSDKAAVPGVNRNALHAEPVIVPPRSIQAKFGEIASSQLNLSSKNVSQTAVLDQIRDAILPRLLSGDLTIPNADRIVGAAT